MEMMQMTWITPSSPALPKPKSFRCFRANLNLYKNEGEMVERVIILSVLLSFPDHCVTMNVP